MSDAVQMALINSATTVVASFFTILTLVITHFLNDKKLTKIEKLANGTLTAMQQRTNKLEDTIAGQLPAETNPKKILVIVEEPKLKSYE